MYFESYEQDKHRKEMKAYIICDSPLGSDYTGGAMYIIATEDKHLYKRWCSSRAFADVDLTVGIQTILADNGVTEVISNGGIVWENGLLTSEVCAKFTQAQQDYERENSDAI